MSIDEFIPSFWSGRLLAHLNNAHIGKKCCNTDYEGEITQYGDSVRISQIGRITVKDFTKNSDIDDPETIDGSQQVLHIDQAKYYNYLVDDVDKAQQKPKIADEAQREASWGLADEADLHIFETMWNGVADASPDNSLGDVGTLAADEVYELFTQMAQKLDEMNTPSGDRFLLIKPRTLKLLRDDDRFSSFGTSANRETIRGGTIDKIADFSVKISNNLPDGDMDAWSSLSLGSGHQGIIAGYMGATTFADQVVKTEAFRPEKRFADAVKGLHVYGCKVTRPANLVTAYYDVA